MESSTSMTHVPLSTGLGELMAPQTLVTALIVSPDGTATLDPGALHGRSRLEGQLRLVNKRQEVGQAESFWIAWVALELDEAKAPVRYLGISVSQLLVNHSEQLGYKSVAEQVNRMSESMRGEAKLAQLSRSQRIAVKEQLLAIGAPLWAEASDVFRKAVESP